MIARILPISCLLIAPVFAQDGGQIYAQSCGVCHGADGKGAGGGAFPPLAGSPWLVGEPDRAIKIALHGLHGPVEVLGKTYNLEMPPQGAMLTDANLAAIMTYIRTSWGNKESAVSADIVTKIRAETKSRTEYWTAEELLKLHPIKIIPPIENLISSTYKGDWKQMPDFTTLKPNAVEEEHAGKITLGKAVKVPKQKKDAPPQKNPSFAMVWDGTLQIATAGDYDFRLEADDSGNFILADKKLIEIKGAGPAKGRGKEATTSLTAGPQKLRVEYLDNGGNREIHVLWRKKGTTEWKYLSDEKTAKQWPPIILEPIAGRTVIYRNFIEGATPTAIGVGLPGGVNFAYSQDFFAPQLIWTGKFIDAGRHWTDRGMGNEPPAGNKVLKLTKTAALPEGSRFRGYKLDPAGNPTFSAQIGDLTVLDSYISSPPTTLVRTVKVSGKSAQATALVLVDNLPVTAAGPDTFDIGGKLTLTVKSAKIDDGKLVLPLTADTATEIRYLWK